MSTVHVANVAFSTTEESLFSFFSQNPGFQSVELKYGSDGRSRGWALVTFSSPEDASSCVAATDGSVIDDRSIRVKLDGHSHGGERQQRRGNGAGAGANDNNQGVPISSTRLFVGNLPWSVDDNALYQMFEFYNPVSATVTMGFDGRSRGYGLVEFASTEVAESAIQGLNNTEMDGRTVFVRFDQGNKKRERAPAAPNSSVFVRGIPHGMDWKGLKDLFIEFNPQFADVSSRGGWGTVRFTDSDVASEAILRFNGAEMELPTGGPFKLECRYDAKPPASY